MGDRAHGVVRVGVLGCGNVGAALVRALDANADLITQRSGVRLEVARVAVHNLAKERDVELAPGVLTNDADAVVTDPNVDVVVEVIGGVEPARSLILTALKARQARDHREQGAPRQFRRGAVRGGRDRRRRPAVRSVGCRWHPADAAAARVARGRAHPACHGHRERHDQLRAHADDRGGLELRGSGRGGTGARVRRARSHRRRRGLRRRGEGGDHRVDRVRRACRRRRRVPRRHHADRRRRHRGGERARLRREAARDRRGARRQRRRAGAPGDGAARSSARIGARLVQCGVHRG